LACLPSLRESHTVSFTHWYGMQSANSGEDGIVSLAFDNVNQVYNTRFGIVLSQGAFADLIVCLTEFSKNIKFQKKSLQAIELLKSSIPKMLRTPECPLSARAGVIGDTDRAQATPKQPTSQTEEEQYWFPVLFAFHDVLMTGEDLEVRSRYVSSSPLYRLTQFARTYFLTFF
jgi:brefeldin A-inhibited guanine nucleotide-exchange protein